MSWSACLVRIQRKDKFESFLVTADKFTIGRSPECDFVIPDSQISRKHLGILIRSGQIFIKDLHSANGSKMGAVKVPVDNVIAYQNGEALRLGTADLTIYLEYVEKKIDTKNITDAELPTDLQKEFSEYLLKSKNRTKELFDEYESLVQSFKEYTRSESEKVAAETQRQIQQSEEKAKEIILASEKKTTDLSAVAEAEIKKKNQLADENAAAVIAAAEEKASQSLVAAEEKAKATIQAADEKALHLVTTGEAKLQDLLTRLEAEEKKLLSETKAKNQQLIDRMQAEASKKADEILIDAGTKAKSLVRDAESECEVLLASARSKNATLLNEAEIRTQGQIQEAELKAEKTIADAIATAKEKTARAETEANEILETAQHKANQLSIESELIAKKLMQDVQKQLDSEYEKFEEHKKSELARLQSENEAFKAKIETATKKEQEKYRDEYNLKLRLFDDECTIRRKNLERDLSGQVKKLEELKGQEADFANKVTAAAETFELESKKIIDLNQDLEALRGQVTVLNQQISNQKHNLEVIAQDKANLEVSVADLSKVRESENSKITALRQQLKQEKQNLDVELQSGRGRITEDLAKIREKELKDIDRLRVDALAQIEALRTKATEEIVQNKSMFMINLAERVQGLFVALHKKSSDDLNLPALKTEIFNMIQGAVEEQSFELTQKHEGDIRHLVKQETQKRKISARRAGGAVAAIAASAIGFYIYQGGNIENIVLGKNSQGESAAEEFGRQQREQRDSKKFEPPQSDFIKSTYTDNVLYTRNYFSVFTNPQVQEQWITLLNGVFSKDFNLEDDAIVKFVAAESTLVTKLQQEKDQVIPDFAQIGIDKMRKVEKESTEQMKAILKEPAHIRKFQSISEKFWFDKLQERLPASK